MYNFPLLSPELGRTIAFLSSCCIFYKHEKGFTHMKLQKLLYYMQGFHLAKVDVPLFPEDIEAWEHGPVVREAWYALHEYEAEDLPVIDYKLEGDPFTSEYFDSYQTRLMHWVYKARGVSSASALRDRTHRESPWRKTYRSGYGMVIPPARMKRFFATVTR